MTLDDETFFITLFVLSIIMVWAMMAFTLALITRSRRPAAKPGSLAELRATLLALNTPDRKFRLVLLSDTEMRLDWDVVDASWYELFAKVKLTTIYRARLLLYEPEHEVRCHEMLRSANWLLGFEGLSGLRGLRPRFNWDFYYRSGVMNVIWSGLAYGIKKGWPPRIGEVYRFTLNTVAAKQDIAAAAREVGWAFRPVLFKFETTAWGAALAKHLTPPFMRGWSRKKFWGSIYAAAWVGIIGLFLTFMPWPPTGKDLLFVALIPAAFWAFQAFVVLIFRATERYTERKKARHRRT